MFLLLSLSALAAPETWGPDKKALYSKQSVVIDAPMAEVRAHVQDLKTWKDWTNWTAERDPECVWEYHDEPGGVIGDSMDWDGPELGTGRVVFTESSETLLVYDTYFGRNPDSAPGRFTFTEVQGGTQVDWEYYSHAGLFARLFKKKIEGMIAEDFRVGLEGLKDELE